MKLSRITLAYGIYIVISAAFMQQFRNWLARIFGEEAVLNCFCAFFVLLALGIILYVFKRGLGFLRACGVFFIFTLAYAFSMWQPYFSERTHVLTYGLLGYLAAGDLMVGGLKLKNFILAICFVALVSASDELFQFFLPYRVGDFRDFVTNVIGGVFGIILLLALNAKFPLTNRQKVL